MANRRTLDLKGVMASTSPGCAVRFFRFVYRDTLESNILTTKADSLGLHGIVHNSDPKLALVTEPLDASKDILNCTVTKSKDRAAGTFQVTLAPGNANYHAAVHPGDHVLIFMKRDSKKITAEGGLLGSLAALGMAGATGISGNSLDSGLKMWGVVQSVRVSRSTDPETGRVSVRYTISGDDFGHFFETDLYFNHIIAEKLKLDGIRVFHQVFNWIVNLSWGSPSKNVEDLLNAFIGNQINTQALGSPYATPNSNFVIPSAVGSYFRGSTGDTRLTNVVQRQIGVLDYGSASSVPKVKAELTGTRFIQIDTGTAFSLWSVLQAYGNTLVNEFFLDLKPDQSGHLVPTFVGRQFPWSSSKAKPSLPTTAFISLPRLVLPEKYIFSEDFGRNEQGRFNFIQIWGTGRLLDGAQDWQPQQVIDGNFAMDKQSVRRHGVRALVQTTDADLDLRALHGKVNSTTEVRDFVKKNPDGKFTFITKWAQLFADWFLPNHMYETGTVQTLGIEEHLSLGDNLEIERTSGSNELYHIHAYSHSFSIDPFVGKPLFRTTISLTRGQTVDEKPIFSATLNIGDPDRTRPGATNTSREEKQIGNRPVTRKK